MRLRSRVARRILPALLAWAATASPQSVPAEAYRSSASHVVIPQVRSYPLQERPAGVTLESVRAGISILDRTASTTLEIVVRNPGGRPEEAELLLPVPEGAVVSAFAFEGPAREPTARILPSAEARRTYDGIVAKTRDPALLEFAGYNLIRSSVFPVPSGGTQRVRITYDHLLPGDNSRIDYVLPRSEMISSTGIPWQIEAEIRSKTPVSTIFSPSHPIAVERVSPELARVRGGPDASRTPGPFLLSMLLEGDGVTASLFAYPDPKIGGGYFLLLAGLPGRRPEEQGVIRREVTLVLDRSGSMLGKPMEQVRDSAIRICESLREGEAFNIIDYATTVSKFAGRPVLRNATSLEEARRYLASLRPMGGTNIHDALVEALRQPPVPGCLPIVLFLTDGLPTIGPFSETAIRQAVETGNPHRRRVFTLGVGTELNAPLLDRLAEMTRGTSDYILPGEDISRRVDQVFRRLSGPLLTDGVLAVLDAEGQVTTRVAHELIPDRVPDLFEGDPFVLLGQYRGEGPITFRLSGTWAGSAKTFSFTFPMADATTRNAFVPRLWASRRIAFLIDAIRQMGAASASGSGPPLALSDPRFRELTDEIVRLSTEFGILTEYTSFLATEGSNFASLDALLISCANELNGKAVTKRSGLEAIAQSRNIEGQKKQAVLNASNGYWDAKMNRVEIATVQQVCDRAFFLRGNRWVDSKALAAGAVLREDLVVSFGSEAYRALLDRLVGEGRQGLLAQQGEILLRVGEQNILVK
ncbi:MAG: VWA domain-containing protein [Planctomycetes bacterium]|nr:VWA domain-containing protein [Planctomycetota bacterium]